MRIIYDEHLFEQESSLLYQKSAFSDCEDIAERIESGATILNVSGGKDTARIVRNIREKYPEFPIIATGGPTEESILETIEAGANAITYTPPTTAEIMGHLMDKYRDF